MMDSLLLYKILKNRTGAEISASGNPAIMSDTLKNNPMNEMKVFGWSKQESTTGANLIDVDSMLNECLVKNDDGTYSILKTETNRFSKRFPVNLTAGTAVRFGADVIEYNGAYRFNLQISLNYQTISVGQGIILDRDVTEVAIYQDSKNDVGTYTKFKNAILSIGKAQIPYEPYTGGQPSPSPDYPQEIVSAGSDGKIGVEVRGKNLFDFSSLVSDGVNAMDYDKQTITVPAKTNNTGYNQTLHDLCPGITPGTYAFSAKRSNPESGNGSYFLEAGLDFPFNVPTELTDALLDNHIAWYNNPDSEVENVISEIQIEKGNAVTSYEPYHTPQSLSISTPTGLPAIPVDSDGNYTDANGQQWISDYVDLKRGKYVQNINTCTVDSSTNVFRLGGQGIYWNLPENSLPGILKGIGINSKYQIFPSKYFERRRFNANTAYSMLYTYVDNMKGLFNSIEELNTFCKERYDAGDPVEFYYVIEPIERDLTPEEIQAYKNLATYAGTTIVENDAECYMEVSAGGGDALRAKKLALLLGD